MDTAELVGAALVHLSGIADLATLQMRHALGRAGEAVRAAVWELQQVLGGWDRFDLRDASVACRELSDGEVSLGNALRFWQADGWAGATADADWLVVELRSAIRALARVVAGAGDAFTADGANWDCGALARAARHFWTAAEALMAGEVASAPPEADGAAATGERPSAPPPIWSARAEHAGMVQMGQSAAWLAGLRRLGVGWRDNR